MDSFKKLEIWFLTGSQHLYGQETLNKVADNAQHIVHYLKNNLPIQLIFKPVLKSSGEIYQLILDANYNTDCIVLALSPGCIRFRHQKCGLTD